MSEASTDEPVVDSQGSEVVELPSNPDAAFGALMDALAPEEEPKEGGAAGGDDSAAGQSAGKDPSQGAGAGAAGKAEAGDGDGKDVGAGSADAKTGAGDGASAGAGGADSGAAGTDAGGTGATAGSADGAPPADWTADGAELAPKFGELSTAFEENVAKSYQEEALEEVREEHAPYFEALEKHPRLLVGVEVPAIGREGMETLKSTEDAREWQEAVKSLLVDEVRGRASKQLDDNKDFLTTIHGSIEIFQNNIDLIPGTKGFDVDLANRFVQLCKPYEIRNDEKKLIGYTIAVQPLIDNLRMHIASERASKPAEPASSPSKDAGASAGKAGSPGTAPSPGDQPQAGIASKSGKSSEDAEDFSTLFGTLHPDLANMRI